MLVALFSVSYAAHLGRRATPRRPSSAGAGQGFSLQALVRTRDLGRAEGIQRSTRQVVARLTDKTIRVTHDYSGKTPSASGDVSVELADRTLAERLGHRDQIRLFSDNLPLAGRGGPG
jgi:hypothetical protein